MVEEIDNDGGLESLMISLMSILDVLTTGGRVGLGGGMSSTVPFLKGSSVDDDILIADAGFTVDDSSSEGVNFLIVFTLACVAGVALFSMLFLFALSSSSSDLSIVSLMTLPGIRSPSW